MEPCENRSQEKVQEGGNINLYLQFFYIVICIIFII